MDMHEKAQAQDIGGRALELQAELTTARSSRDNDSIKRITRAIRDLVSDDVRGNHDPYIKIKRYSRPRQIGDSNPSHGTWDVNSIG